MLVCLQFESIGRLPDDVAAAHSGYERVTARTVAELEDGVRPWFQPWKSST